MPCFEAMALGVLSATVDFSGSTEFMKRSNSLLIKPIKLVKVDALSAMKNPIYSGHRWAEVKLSLVKRIMRMAINNQNKWARLRKRALKDIISYFDTQIVVDNMISKLNKININRKKGNFVIYRNPLKMVINQLEQTFEINIVYFKLYKSLKLFTSRDLTFTYNHHRQRS